MKKKILFLIIFSFVFLTKAQKSFSTEYEARYTLDYKNINLPNAKSRLTTFILLMNDKESYFKSMNVYVQDSLVYYKKINESGNIMTHLNAFSKLSTEYPENIGVTAGKIYVTTPIKYGNAQYEEFNNIEWKLVNEYKTIGDMKCQKAVSTKYGRNWTAYFNPDIPLNFGPYKFNKLPGLIVELYDENDYFHYKLYKFKKRKGICFYANLYKKPKYVKKEKVYQFTKNSFLDTNHFESLIDTDPETMREIRQKMKKLYDQYIPIELSPN